MSGASHHFTYGSSMSADARRTLTARRDALRAQPSSEPAMIELREVEEALQRIDAGTWGRCLACNGAIGRDRLRALPDARHCISCSR
jgi:RNA polymerase-binding transcription factor DksA